MNELTKFVTVIGLTTAIVATIYCLTLLMSKLVDQMISGPRCKKCRGKILHMEDWRRKR